MITQKNTKILVECISALCSWKLDGEEKNIIIGNEEALKGRNELILTQFEKIILKNIV